MRYLRAVGKWLGTALLLGYLWFAVSYVCAATTTPASRAVTMLIVCLIVSLGTAAVFRFRVCRRRSGNLLVVAAAWVICWLLLHFIADRNVGQWITRPDSANRNYLDFWGEPAGFLPENPPEIKQDSR